MKLSPRYVIVILLIISSIVFRAYLFKGFVPIQFNLLPSFYSPWKYIAWPGYPSGVSNKPMGTDNPKLFYPYRKFTIDELKKGRIPLWNPYVFSGNIHTATYQSAVFYPFNILYLFIPQADAWSILVFIQPILAGLFTFLFLKSLSISDRGSLFGAISYAFSGWMIAWWEESIVIEHSILWLPLALYGSSQLLQRERKQKTGFILLVTAFSMSIFAGFLQMTLYLGLTVTVWNIFLWIHNRESKKRLIWFIFSILLALCITAIQWVPALEAYSISPRGKVGATFLFDEFLVPLKHILTMIAPDFWGNPGSYNYFFPGIFYHEKVIYMGIVPLVFIIHSFFKRFSDKKVHFWKIFSIVSLSLGFAIPTSWVWYVLHVPILSVANPSRIFAISAFGFSILTAFGFDAWWEKRNIRSILLPFFIIGSILIVLWIFVLFMYVVAVQFIWISIFCSNNVSLASFCNWITYTHIDKWGLPYGTISLRNLILPSILFIATCFFICTFSKKQRFLYVSLLVLAVFGQIYFAYKFLYFSDRRFEFPEVTAIQKIKSLSGYSRVWSYGNAYIEKNIPSYFGLYSVEGYDALFSQQYGELLYTIKNNGQLTSQIHRTDVDLKQAAEVEPLGDNLARLRIMSLLGVKYILETKLGENKDKLSIEKRFPTQLFTIAWEDDSWRIWEYKNALSRTFFVPSYRKELNKEKTVETLLDPSFDYRKTVILEEDIPKRYQLLSNIKEDLINTNSVDIVSYKPDQVVLNVIAKQPGIVFLSDTFYPGWNVYVDGEKTKLYRANYAFRAVPVLEGSHRVIFQFQPKSFTYSIWISAVGIVIFIYLLLIHQFKKKT